LPYVLQHSQDVLPGAGVLPGSSVAGPPPDKGVTTTLKSKVQLVLEDVVVTDHVGQPIKGIPRDRFEVLENEHPQTIASFEEPS